MIELLVVISIITLLIGILLPALRSARAAARTVQGLAHQSQVGRAVSSYTTDHAGTFPTGWRQDDHPAFRDDDTNWVWIISDHLAGTGSTRGTRTAGSTNPIFRDPNAALDGGSVHYSGHPVIFVDVTRTSLPHYRVEQVARGSEVVLVMDASQVPPANNASATAVGIDDCGLWGGDCGLVALSLDPHYYDPDEDDNDEAIDPGPDEDGTAGAAQIRWRQSRGEAANLLFADGHAATRGRSEVRKKHIRPDP